MSKLSHSYVTWWRKNGAPIIFIVQLLSCWNQILFGIVTLVWLTVPCGISEVNTNKPMWLFRQAIFLFIGILIILSGIYGV